MTIARRFLRNHWGKAIGLLAVAGFLAVVWWELPPVPRAAWMVPKGACRVGLTADGGLLLTHSGDRSNAVAGSGGIWDTRHYDCPLQLWDTINGRLLATLFSDRTRFSTVQLSPDGRHLATISEGLPAQLKIFEASTCREIGTFLAANEPTRWPLRVCFSPDGRTLAAETQNRGGDSVVLWDMDSQTRRAELVDQGGPLVFSRDSRTVVTTSRERDRVGLPGPTVVAVWDAISGRRIMESPTIGDNFHLYQVGLDSTKKMVGVVGHAWLLDQDHPQHLDRLIVWDVKSGSEILRRDMPLSQDSSVDGDLLDNWYVLQRSDHRVNLVQRMTSADVATFPATSMLPDPSLHFTDRAVLGSPNNEGILSNWRLSGCGRNPVWHWLRDQLAFLGVGSADSPTEIGFWNVADGRHLATIYGQFYYPQYSSDGTVMAVMNGDERLEIWDIPPRKPLGWFLGLAGLLLILTIGGFWWQARRRKRKAALATEAISCGMC
jgi:WD40 repeat protein